MTLVKLISRSFSIYRKRINLHSRADKLPHPRKFVVGLTPKFKNMAYGAKFTHHVTRVRAIRHHTSRSNEGYMLHRGCTALTNLYFSNDANLKGDDIAKVTCQRTNAFIRLTGIDIHRRENVRWSVVAIRSTNLISISSG